VGKTYDNERIEDKCIAPTNSPTTTPTNSPTPPCFPGSAVVTLDNGNKKTMADLVVGDKVLTSNGTYSEVYMFSHRFVDAEATFVRLSAGNATLELTAGHYLYVNGVLRPAEFVTVGANVTLADGASATVTGVGTVRNKGIYNPHTMQGDIVVNGVLTSTYTSAFSPSLAHVVLAPIRALYRMGVDIFKFDIGSALDALPSWWTSYYKSED